MERFLRNLLTLSLNDNTGKTEVESIVRTEFEDTTVFDITIKYWVTLDSEPLILKDSLVVPTIENGLPSGGTGRQKVVITAARSIKTIRCYNNQIGVGAKKGRTFYINFDTNTVQVDTTFINLFSFLAQYDLLDKYYPNFNDTVQGMSDEDIKLCDEFEFPTYVITKLNILFETKYTRTNICKDTIDKILKVFHNQSLREIVTPADFGYYSVYESLVQDLRMETNYHRFKRFIIDNINKNKKLYLTPVQSYIDKFFRMQNMNFNSVQTGKDTNALSMDVQSKRIYFYEGNFKSGYDKIQLYNNYFIGVLDPIKTQDGVNVNYSNELPTNTKIVDSDLQIEVINKNWERVQLTYDEYAISAILVEDQVDEDHHKIEPRNGVYVIYQFGKYYEVTNPSDIDYYRPSDGLTSPATAMVPFLNKEDSTRGMLGAHMIEQAIPVVDAKPSIVYTPESERIFRRSALNIRSKYDGEVVDIYKDGSMIKIRDEEGNDHIVESPMFDNTVQSTTNEYYTTLKVGDKVKKGTPIYVLNSFKDDQFAIGVPLYAALTTYNGFDHEDGYVLTESAIKKFAHPSVEVIVVDLPNKYYYEFTDQNLLERDRFSDWGIIKEGMGVNAGDVIMEYLIYLDETTKMGNLRRTYGQGGTYATEQIKVPAKIRSGIVKDVKVLHNADLNNKMTEYYDKLAYAKQDSRNEFTGAHTVAETLLPKDSKDAYQVQITIEYYLVGDLGSKFSNFYGSKGVCSGIIPDELAPRDAEGRPFEVMFSPLSTYSRKNPSQIYEAKMGLVGVRGFELVERWKRGEEPFERVNQFLKLVYDFYDGKEETANQIYDKFKKYGYLRFKVTPFDKFYTNTRIIEALEFLGLGNGDMNVYFPEYHRWTTNKITVGYINIMRLHFIAEDRMTASSITNIVSELPFGYGHVKEEGQKLGGQEVYAYMSHGKINELAKTISENSPNKRDTLFAATLCLGMSIEED